MNTFNIPSHLDVLKSAKAWRVDATPEALSQAEKTLRQGIIDFPFELSLVEELALVLTKGDQDSAAMKLLEDTRQRFKQPTEEMLCRLGKIYKKMADEQVKNGHESPALNSLDTASKYYGEAFEMSTHFYPRINQLTIRLIRASIEKDIDRKQELLSGLRADTQDLLNRPELWLPRRSDDEVWIPASQGEAFLLMQDFSRAEEAYRQAMSKSGNEKFYYQAMCDQIQKLIQPAYHRLSWIMQAPFTDPLAFFTPSV